MRNLNRGNRSPKMSATTHVIFKKLTKVSNHPMGKNSPNPVTLLPSRDQRRSCCCFREKNWRENESYVLRLLQMSDQMSL
jgi:hypothetical protein